MHAPEESRDNNGIATWLTPSPCFLRGITTHDSLESTHSTSTVRATHITGATPMPDSRLRNKDSRTTTASSAHHRRASPPRAPIAAAAARVAASQWQQPASCSPPLSTAHAAACSPFRLSVFCEVRPRRPTTLLRFSILGLLPFSDLCLKF